MLSHDLFEGIFARAGLASDIELVEAFPGRYDVTRSRQHRWTRGDWQLLPWILGPRARTVPYRGWWKMLDNLRRSVTPPAIVLALLLCCQLPLSQALYCAFFVLLPVMLPPLLPVIGDLWPTHAAVGLLSHSRMLANDLRAAGNQIALQVVLIAEQAATMADAIVRTLIRLFVTHRNLLEWTTHEQAQASLQSDLAGYYRRMPGTLVLAAACAGMAFSRSSAWPLSTALAALWFLAPAIAYWASTAKGDQEEEEASPEALRALRLIGRRTWRFFETFVTPDDNMLPPDNFQEDPKPVIAHRTSPTNIGLYLLSVASAHDLGWLSLLETVDRIEACFATLDKLERINGHFLNWYDTTDLRPLSPKYVSSVDSGNLAGHLITLANACEAWIEQPVIGARMVAGIQDTIELARQSLEGNGARMGSGPAAIVIGGISADLDALQAIFTAPYGELASAAAVSEKLVAALATLNCPNQAELSAWIHAIEGCISGHAGDLAWLFPVAMPSYDNQSSPTLRALTANALTSPSGGARAHDLCRRLTTLAQRARTFAESMDFEFLLDKERRLLSIGFLPNEGTLDGSCYDLLASEARLASFFAIAKSDVPVSHWFRLGRSMVPIGEGAALISWSGSMFEYLMPSLIMRAPQLSLLASTNRMIVQHQIDYASSLGLPWGMSESAFSARDLEMTYQYSNFGVPDLALKRGLSEQAVIAPYATALAAMVAPAAAVTNFGRLAAAGGLGSYGYFEALDYTRARLPAGETVSVVRAYMAHHQGMSIVAICNAVLDGIVRTRFHAEPLVQANELLLQERAPREVMRAQERPEDLPAADPASAVSSAPACRRIHSPHDAAPATHILSNGRYSVMLTASGSGYSRWQGLAVTRWREDPTLDDWGSYIFIRDVGSDRIWSAGYLPTGMEADSYTVTFHEERAEILRRDGSIMSHLEIVVSAEDDAEVRRLTLTNTGAEPLELEVTSFAELVLASPADDDSHPAFSKMFVQTEFLPELGTLLATRRRRAPAEPEIWAAHLLVLEGKAIGDLHMETDRAAFIGRGRDTRNPAAMAAGRPLSGTVGTVLDPIFSLRRRLQIEPGGSARLAFWTVVASSRADALSLADRHRDSAAFDRALTLAWTQAQVQLRHLGIAHAEAGLFQRLAGHLLYSSALLRPPSDILLRCGSQGQAGLWAHGISGDLPILLIRIDVVADMELIRRLLAAHEYWRLKQLAVDIVILNEKSGSYLGELQDLLEAALRIGQTRTAVVQGVVRGSVYVLRPDIIGSEATAQLMSVARAVLVSRRGPLDEQFEQLDAQKRSRPTRPIRLAAPPAAGDAQGEEPPPLEFFNGIGGFTKHGREYVVLLRDGRTTPAPWSNVIANDAFGFLCTAEGGGYSWWRNSRENHITAWSNDPVSDRPSDVVYVRDEETGAIFGPTASPARIRNADYTVHHGMGYSRFRARIFEIDQDLLSFVPADDPVKVARLTLRNTSERPRRLSVTWYLEWNLGPSRSSAAHVQTEHDRARHAILARNPWNTALGPMVAFAAMPDRNPAVTGDRREFLGRNGTLAQPAALCRALPLSNRTGAGFDPCAALQVQIELLPGEATEVTLLLGAADSAEGAGDLLSKYAAADIDQLLAAVQATWDGIIGGTQVTTPDRSLDVMLNGWLLYQSLGCRTWARAGFYQASGAYGFRDQLQDGMAIVLARPDLARAHLVRAAGRQFPEGDVQHWWLPPQGRGVRTRIMDDRAWLAFAALRYMTVTGDSTLLSDAVPFLDGPVLPPHDQEAYFLPSTSATSASVYEHSAVGLDSSLTTGPHGLPLFGSGDWNDGMNRVGAGGSGESVWMAWFLHAALTGFAPIAEAKGDTDRAARWRAHAAELQASVERSAWDGNWYRRGYYDDGTPLGSVASSECRIDSIAQSWAVISGAGQPERAARAMGAVDDHLMRRQDGLALLFTPPFDHTPLDPGYIKGYPPGLRENGGQYTHAGAWAVIALTLLGEADRACELFAMMNPINHALTAADAHRYKVEPYVMAADVYAAPGHVGRGGWTWYTGSAAWMYRAGLEHVLGCRREAGWLRIEPCIPASWPGYEVKLRVGPNITIISVQNPQAVSAGVHQAWLDDIEIFERPLRIALAADGRDHHLRVVLGEAPILGTE
jgi:cyclic beta-1,2-glucan synthetase